MPATTIPSVGYFDDINNKVIIWYGASAYQSANGNIFTQVGGTTCTPDWQCTNWGTCSGGTQTRTCTDANACGTSTGKPAESQSCTTTCTSGQRQCTSSTNYQICSAGGSWGSAQSCGVDEECNTDDGSCVDISCVPNTCGQVQCGNFNNGCSIESCGTCASGYVCNPQGQCITSACTQNSQCGIGNSTLICNGNSIINSTITPTCSSNNCQFIQTNTTLTTCSSGQQCSNGACSTISTCVDGDGGGGSQTYIKGQVNLTIGTLLKTFNDSCFNSTAVTEYSCVGNSGVTNVNQTCLNGCLNGACIGTAVEICKDNDGINYNIRSSLNYTLDGVFQPDGAEFYTDFCDEDNHTLYEAICDGNTSDFELYDCSDLNKICKLGVCATRTSGSGGGTGGGSGGGSCTSSSCDGQYYIGCVSGEELDPVKVPGQCNYNPETAGSCVDDSDCGEGYFCNSDDVCEREVTTTTNAPANIPALYYFIIVLVILIIAVVIAGIYFYLQKKNKNAKKSGGSSGPSGQQRPGMPPRFPPFFPQGQQVRPQQMPQRPQPTQPARPVQQGPPQGQPQGINRFNPFAGR